MARCEICGDELTRGEKYGVCRRHPECARELDRRYCRAQKARKRVTSPRRTCEICGAAMFRNSRHGVCTRKPGCLREWRRRSKVEKAGPAPRCGMCGATLTRKNTVGLCQSNEICRRAHNRALRMKNIAQVRRSARESYARHRESYLEKQRDRRKTEHGRRWSREYQRRRRSEDPGYAEKGRQRGRRYYAINRETMIRKAEEYAERNADAIRARRVVRSLLNGSSPTFVFGGHGRLRGDMSPNWRGGGVGYCVFCDACLGWCSPKRIRAAGRNCGSRECRAKAVRAARSRGAFAEYELRKASAMKKAWKRRKAKGNKHDQN